MFLFEIDIWEWVEIVHLSLTNSGKNDKNLLVQLNNLEEVMEENFVTEDMLQWAHERTMAREYLRELDERESISEKMRYVLIQLYSWFEQDSSLEASMIRIKVVRLLERYQVKTPQFEESAANAA